MSTSALPTSGVAGGRAWTARHPRADAALQRATFTLTVLFPYFTTDAYTLQPAFVEGLGAVGVTRHRVLVMDPELVLKWSREELAFYIARELFYCFLNSWGWLRPGMDSETWQVAREMEASDDLVKDTRAKWPTAPIVPSLAELPDHRLGEWYYEQLMARGGCQSPQAKGTAPGGKGKGSIPPTPGVPGVGDQPGQGSVPGDVAGDLDNQLGRSEAMLEADRLATASAIDAEVASKGRGNMPESLLRQAEMLRRPAVCDWKTVLPRLVRGHLLNRPGSRHPTYRRRHKMQGALSRLPRTPVLSGSYDSMPLVWIGIDTSGSMSEHELTEGVTELRHVLRAIGCRARFLVIDAAIHKDVEVDESTDLTQFLVGGGGTSFIPVFEEAMAADRRPDVIFFYTDGDGAAPAEEPPIPTVWMLTAEGREPAKWGQKVRIVPRKRTAPLGA